MEWSRRKKTEVKTGVSLRKMAKDAQAFIDAYDDESVSRKTWQKNTQKKSSGPKGNTRQSYVQQKS